MTEYVDEADNYAADPVSDDEKLAIAKHMLMSSPPGQFWDVLAGEENTHTYLRIHTHKNTDRRMPCRLVDNDATGISRFLGRGPHAPAAKRKSVFFLCLEKVAGGRTRCKSSEQGLLALDSLSCRRANIHHLVIYFFYVGKT